jgi:hypothetical protein
MVVVQEQEGSFCTIFALPMSPNSSMFYPQGTEAFIALHVLHCDMVSAALTCQDIIMTLLGTPPLQE